MAITIQRTPDTISPVYNTNFIKLTDSSAGNVDYKYIIKVYYKYTTSASMTLISTFTQFPLQDGSMEFEPNSILRNYIQNTYDYNTGSWSLRNSIFQAQVTISRTYSGAGELLIYNFDPLYVFDGAVSQAELDQLSTIITKISPASTTTINRSISNTPTELKLSKYDYYSADYFVNKPNTILCANNVGMEIYHSGGTEYYNSVALYQDQKLEHCIISMGVGPMNIKSAVWTGAFVGTKTGQEIFDRKDFTSYKIYFYDYIYPSTYPILSKPITVTFCENEIETLNFKSYDRTWLVYKSKLGGWSWLLFNMKASKKQNTVNNTYNRRLKYNETYKQRGTTVISNMVTQSYTLNTDWVNVDTFEFYEDLFSSPQVYMYQQYKNKTLNTIDPFTPCVITTTSTPIFKPNNDKLFQYTIEVEDANKKIRQI